MLGRELSYVALAVSDDEGAARVLGSALGLKRTDLDDGHGTPIPVFAIGQSGLALFPLGHPGVGGATRPGVHHIALGCGHLDDALAEAKRAGMHPVRPDPQIGLGGRRRIALDPATTADVRTWIT